jgi:hypothetical protein
MARCFVIQPFDDNGEYDKRYRDVLVPAIKDAGLEPYRVDQDPSVTVPIDDIEKGIRESEICVADITTNNPNIWYEVGYAMANHKPVVLICADPRLHPYPFDIRHRHIIPYKLHSLSDFEQLKQEITIRLNAQVQKAEELQAVAALSEVKITGGLSPHEIAVLVAIMSSISSPEFGESPWEIQQAMQRSGFTAVASTLALAGLMRKEMVDLSEVSNEDGEQYNVYKVSPKGLDWVLANEHLFRLRKEESPLPLTDEDIPF